MSLVDELIANGGIAIRSGITGISQLPFRRDTDTATLAHVQDIIDRLLPHLLEGKWQEAMDAECLDWSIESPTSVIIDGLRIGFDTEIYIEEV